VGDADDDTMEPLLAPLLLPPLPPLRARVGDTGCDLEGLPRLDRLAVPAAAAAREGLEAPLFSAAAALPDAKGDPAGAVEAASVEEMRNKEPTCYDVLTSICKN
jgi:hypothetical protein